MPLLRFLGHALPSHLKISVQTPEIRWVMQTISQTPSFVTDIVDSTKRWPGLSRHRFGFDKWSVCRWVSVCAIAGASRREGVARPV